MTQTKSAADTFSFTFFRALKKLPLFSLAYTFVFGDLGLITLAAFVFGPQAPLPESQLVGATPHTAETLAKFVLMDTEPAVLWALTFLVVGLAILCGLVLFAPFADKKRVNVYYSLGITRSNLFLGRLSAGAAALTVGILAAFLLLAGVNIHYFGSSRELWLAAAYLALSYLLMALFALGVTGAVMSSVGTAPEGVVFTVLLLLAPSALPFFFEWLMNALVFGSAYLTLYSFRPTHNTDYQLPIPLFEQLMPYNPLTFNTLQVETLGKLTRENATDHFQWTAPSFAPLLLWLVLSVGVMALGTRQFHRRRAEICGFLGRNRVLNFILVCLLGLGAIASLQAIFIGLPTVASILGLCAYGILYLVTELALKRSFRELRLSLKLLPAHLGIGAAALLLCATGLLGYSTRVPKASEVESAAMGSVSHTALLGQYFQGPRDILYGSKLTDASEIMLAHLQDISSHGIGGVKDAAKIESILRLHEKIAKTGRQAGSPLRTDFGDSNQGFPCHVTFAYRLKNGKTFVRSFTSTTAALLEELAALEQAELMDDFYDEMIQPPDPGFSPRTEDWKEYDEDYDSAFQKDERNQFRQFLFQPQVPIVLRPTHLDEEHSLRLTAQQRARLANAVKQDSKAQTAQQILFPQAPALGTLVFPNSIADDIPPEELPEDTPGVEVSRTAHYRVVGRSDSTQLYCLVEPTDEILVHLTPEMTQTLAALRELGLLEKLQNRSAVVRARVYPAVRPTESFYSYNTLHFIGSAHLKVDAEVQEDYYIDCSALWLPDGAAVVTDTALLAALEANAHLQYYLSRNGYVVEFETDKGDFVTMFVPAEKLPQSIADAIGK